MTHTVTCAACGQPMVPPPTICADCERTDQAYRDYAGKDQQPLIAAAPDLLEACRSVNIVLHTVLRKYLQEPWAREIQAAITKATGEAQP